MPRFIIRALVVCVVAALAAPAARADKIDVKLHEQAPAILAALKKADVDTVGVLRFRAERGKKAESFNVGPINDAMAARIENLLIIHGDKTKPIGVLKDPNSAAAAAKVGAWFTSPAARKKLFEHEFPMAWGNKKAKADAFLTGEVQCTGDMTKTTVVIEMFTSKDPAKLVKVVEFTVPTDRLILTDLGERFSVPRGNGAVRRSADLDRFAIGEVRQRENGEMPPNGGERLTEPPTGVLDVGGSGVKFQILSDNVEVLFRAGASTSPKWEVVSPAAGKPVTMTLKNDTPKAVGVVLKVNGVSTIFGQTEDSALCRKWVIEPGKMATLKGFYQEDKQLAPFKVLVGDEAKAMIDQLGPKAGEISIEVFASAASEDDNTLAISLPRRIPDTRNMVAARSAPTPDAVKANLLKPSRMKVVTETKTVNGKAISRELIVPDKDALVPGPDLKEVDFKPAGQPLGSELVKIVKE